MARPEEDGIQEEPLGCRRHRSKVGVVGKRDDVAPAQDLVEDQRLAGHEFERLRPAKPADEQVARGEIHEVAAVGRLERCQDQVRGDQRENLAR